MIMKEGVFSLSSGYLLPGIQLQGLAHHITVSTGSKGGEGSLQLDPNGCQLNEFGDETRCTKIAIRSFPAQLKLLKEADGKRLYAVEAKEYTGPALRVVVPISASKKEFAGRLLVLGKDDSIQSIVSLKHRK
jgi:hypothetical protein